MNIRHTLMLGWRLFSKSERQQVTILCLFMVVTGILEISILGLSVPFMSLVLEPEVTLNNQYAQVAIEFIGTSDHETLALIAFSALVSLLIGISLVSFIVQHNAERFSGKCWRRISHDILERCSKAPYLWFLGQNSVKLNRTYYSDIPLWGRDFVRLGILLVGDTITLIIIVALIITIIPVAGLITIATTGAIVTVTMLLARPKLKKLSVLKRQTAEATVVAGSNIIAGIKDIRFSSKEDRFLHAFDNAIHHAVHAHVWMAFWQRLPPSIMAVIGQIGLATLTIILWSSNLSGAEIAKYLVLGGMLASRAIPAMNRINGGIASLWNVAPFISGIQDIITSLEESEEKHIRYRITSKKKAISKNWRTLSANNISFQFREDEHATISDVSVEIERGKSYGFAGPSGSGKSTILDILLGLLIPNKGSVKVDGIGLTDYDISSWHSRIALIPQSPYMLDGTLMDNITFGEQPGTADRALLMECIDKAQLSEFVSRLPNGLDTPMGERGTNLSGGERQRIAIARALYKKPDLLVLDEATSALDLKNEDKIRQVIHNLTDSTTVIVVAHRLSTLREIDRIFFIENGMVSAEGNFNDLINKCSAFNSLARLQNLPEAPAHKP